MGISLCFKSQQELSERFSRGQASRLWEECACHRKTWRERETERAPGWRATIRSCRQFYKQKALSQKNPASAKGSLVLALPSMKWDWKMVLNGLLNWRNDVLWSLPPKPPLETGIVRMQSSPKSRVIYVEPEPFRYPTETFTPRFHVRTGIPWGRLVCPSAIVFMC